MFRFTATAKNILITPRQFYEGVPTNVECEVVGSRPAPEVTWYLGEDGPMEATFTHVHPETEVTTSVLSLRAHADDIGKALTCVARHPHIDHMLNASFIVDVQCKYLTYFRTLYLK